MTEKTRSKSKAPAKEKDTGPAPEPSFLGYQLAHCKALNFAAPDVIRAVLRDGKRYTIAGAKEEIKNYLTGKV